MSTLITTGRKTPLPAFPIHSYTTRRENLKTTFLVFSKTERAVGRISSLHSHPYALQTVNDMVLCVAKGTLWVWRGEELWGGDGALGRPGGLLCYSEVLHEKSRKVRAQGGCDHACRDGVIWGCVLERDGKRRNWILLRSPRKHPVLLSPFRPLIPRTVREYVPFTLSHSNGGNLLQQPVETDTWCSCWKTLQMKRKQGF